MTRSEVGWVRSVCESGVLAVCMAVAGCDDEPMVSTPLEPAGGTAQNAGSTGEGTEAGSGGSGAGTSTTGAGTSTTGTSQAGAGSTSVATTPDAAMSSGESTDGGVDAGEPTVAATTRSIAGGAFAPLAAYEDTFADIADQAGLGFALIERTSAGAVVTLQVNGLTPDQSYGAHVHALPCEYSGGGHYKIDPGVEGTVDTNELWPVFETDENGSATVVLETDHMPREDGMAVVIHDPEPEAENAKMLCADLAFAPLVEADMETAALASFEDAEPEDQGVTGEASVSFTAEDAAVTLQVAGLTSGETYFASLGNLPCGVEYGGTPYQLDPGAEADDEDNLVRWLLEVDATGASDSSWDDNDPLRADAQSLLVQRIVDADAIAEEEIPLEAEGAVKVACADLPRDRSASWVTQGEASVLEGGEAAELDDLEGLAQMSRASSGETSVTLEVSGAAPATTYPVHVHNRPCAVDQGGGHYKHERTVEETVEANEVWLPLMTDDSGAGRSEVVSDRILRADAEALVMHGEDGTRLACFDLVVQEP